MKLTVEIKDSKFNYSYEVGEEKHNGSSHLSADMLVIFCDLIRVCSSAYKYKDKEWERELIAKGWLEKQARKEVE